MSLIAKNFMLAGIPVEVEPIEGFVKKTGAVGQSYYAHQKILLDFNATPSETLESTFFHEMIHYILFVMNKHTLRNDEDFVDSFAHLLYQALKTGGYDCLSGHALEGCFDPTIAEDHHDEE